MKIVYAINGKDIDRRLNKSIASVKDHIPRSEVFVLTTDPNFHEVKRRLSDKTVTILSTSPQMDAVGFHNKGWNRHWPFEVMCKMFMPILPEFKGAGKVVVLDSDVLAVSDQAEGIFFEDTGGLEVSGCCGDTYGTTFDIVDRAKSCIDDPNDFNLMVDNVWGEHRLSNHTWFNGGVALWDADLIQSNIDLFIKRLLIFWKGELRGKFYTVEEDFTNLCMRSNSILPEKYNHRPYYNPYAPDAAFVHYQALADRRLCPFLLDNN